MRASTHPIEEYIAKYQPRKWKCYKFTWPPYANSSAEELRASDFSPDPDLRLPGETLMKTEGEWPRLQAVTEHASLSVQISESALGRDAAWRAKELNLPTEFFFIDWELASLDLALTTACDVSELAKDWHGYKQGALVMEYMGALREVPPKSMLIIEDKT